MSNSDTTYRQWIAKFENGEFDSPNVHVQISAGWYDWFCKGESLARKTRALAPKVLKISKSKKIDLDKVYIFFKNNCPLDGPLYDDFRICDIESGDVIWTITPKSGHTGLAEVWGNENNFEEPIVEGSIKDVYTYFGV